MAGASAGNIRAGGAFVEIFAKDRAFQQAMTRVQNRLRATAKNLQQFGTGMSLGGAALAAPMLMAIRGAASFEDALLDAKASAGLTAHEIDKVKAKALELSKAGLGGPAEIAQAFTALLKAGMPLEAVMDGAAASVVMFAKNAGLDMTQAAEIASDAMKVFGESTASSTDILKAAADSSSTSVGDMVQAFSQSSAVAGMANQKMHTLAAALAIMANNGVKGSDAGTSLKTMLLRLVTGGDTAAEALARIGLSVNSFRDADGKMLPLANVLDILNGKLAGLDQVQRDNVLSKLFGTDAIRAGTILLTNGSAGLDAMAASMAKAGTNASAFADKASGVSGAMKRVSDSVERFQTAFKDALGSDLITYMSQALAGAIDTIGQLVTKFPMVAKVAAFAATGMIGAGAAAIGMSVAMKGLSTVLGGVSVAARLLMNPIGLFVATAAAGFALVVVAARQLSPAFAREMDAMTTAISQGNLSAAASLLMANMQLTFASAWQGIRHMAQDAMDGVADILGGVWNYAIEGLDRFMGLFGADILTLQSGLEKLGLYFRAAFDWSWAASSLRAALEEVDAQVAKARQRAPTAGARAADRNAETQRQIEQREQVQRASREKDAARLQQLTAMRDSIRQGIEDASKKTSAASDLTAMRGEVSKLTAEIDRLSGAAAQPGSGPQDAPAAEQAPGDTAGGGNTLGTFAADLGTRLAAGPTANAAQQTAANTKRTADGVEQLLRADNGVGDESSVLGSSAAAAPAFPSRGGVLDNLTAAITEQQLANSFAAAGFADPDLEATSRPVDLGSLYGSSAAAAAPDPGLINRAASAAMPSAAQAPVPGSKEVVSVLEKVHLECQKSADHLRNIFQEMKRGGLAFS